jgi:hypothetical protein
MEDKDSLISLDKLSHFFVGVHPFFGCYYTDIFFMVNNVTPIFVTNI